MRFERFKRLGVRGLLALSLMGVGTPVVLQAQDADRGAMTDGDDDMDWGWIGLLGLAGLAGLRRRRDDARVDAATRARA